jgi:quercetin dioxygenase-like cupin family protein
MIVVERGEGQILGSEDLHLIGRAEWTNGGFMVIDQIVPPKTITRAHHHRDQSQAAYVLEGTICFWVDGEESEAGPGTYVVRPAGSVHALWNPGDEEARMLEVTSAATGFQELALAATGAETPAEPLGELAARVGTAFDDEVTEELCRRHGVSPEGGAVRATPGEPVE